MIQTVIFDMDGLLVDTEYISYQIFLDFIRPYGKSMTIKEFASTYSGKTSIVNMKKLRDTYNLNMTYEEQMEFISKRETYYFKQGVPLKKGGIELIQWLKENHYSIVLATSSTQKRAMDIIKSNHIESYFDAFTFGFEVKRGKPYPDIFLLAAKKTNTDPSNCLVLEDSEAGIQAAYNAHIPVICVPDLKTPDIQFQNMTVKTLPSLLDVLDYLKQHS